MKLHKWLNKSESIVLLSWKQWMGYLQNRSIFLYRNFKLIAWYCFYIIVMLGQCMYWRDYIYIYKYLFTFALPSYRVQNHTLNIPLQPLPFTAHGYSNMAPPPLLRAPPIRAERELAVREAALSRSRGQTRWRGRSQTWRGRAHGHAPSLEIQRRKMRWKMRTKA